MSGIDGIGPPPAPRPGGRASPAAPGTGFAPPAGQAPEAPRASMAAAAPVALETLLALQQVDDAPEQDRRARGHGQAMLVALGRLQRALLGGGDLAGSLAELRGLAESVPQAADPALAAAVAQVVLRARIELARRAG